MRDGRRELELLNHFLRCALLTVSGRGMKGSGSAAKFTLSLLGFQPELSCLEFFLQEILDRKCGYFKGGVVQSYLHMQAMIDIFLQKI